MYWWLGWIVAWNRADIGKFYRDRVKQVAYVCRYGGVGLQDALSTDVAYLRDFASAVNELIQEENSPATKPNGRR
jgi:hypothetical protein